MAKSPLNLIYLKYFCDAVQYGSISASARVNFVTQSAISQGIAKLEKALTKDLITHQSNAFRITKDGERVFAMSANIFASLADLEEALREDETAINGAIEFACSHSFALAILPQYLQKVKAKWPELQVNFRLAHTDVIKELVRKGSVDFGFVLDNEDFSAFECRDIYGGHYRLYQAKKSAIQENPLYILSEERMETNLLKKAYRKRYKKDLAVSMEVSSWEVIASLVEEGLGVGFMPDYVARRKKHRLQEHPLAIEPIPYKIYAIFTRNYRRSRSIEAFLELLRANLS